jgi:hypothetical protein
MFHSFHNLKCDTFPNPDLNQTRVPQMQYWSNNGVERDKTRWWHSTLKVWPTSWHATQTKRIKNVMPTLYTGLSYLRKHITWNYLPYTTPAPTASCVITFASTLPTCTQLLTGTGEQVAQLHDIYDDNDPTLIHDVHALLDEKCSTPITDHKYINIGTR